MVIDSSKQIATDTISALKSTPLAIALLAVNIGFLAFSGFVLARVSENSAERNKAQMDLIATLAKECYPAPSKERQ